MHIDGKAIAAEIEERLHNECAERREAPALSIVSAGEHPATQKFIAVKRRFAERIGVSMHERHFSASADTGELVTGIKASARESDGVIVQLPILAPAATQTVLDAIPKQHDVDVLSTEAFHDFEEGTLPIVPPVVGAIAEVLDRADVSVHGAKAVVIGAGRLVGAPAAVWLRRQGATVEVLDETTPDIAKHTQAADIIVSGAGSPGLLGPDMIQEGVILLDAGTSEANGKLVGDIAPECASKARIFTPVPGGIGPITVAKVFENLLVLTRA